MSLRSLTMAQYKVITGPQPQNTKVDPQAQMLTRQFSSSFLQKAICFLSSVCKYLTGVYRSGTSPSLQDQVSVSSSPGSTVSSLLLLTQAFYAISETGGALLLGMAVILLAPCMGSCNSLFRGIGPLKVKGKRGLSSFFRRYSDAMELFQLQSSRVTHTLWNSMGVL